LQQSVDLELSKSTNNISYSNTKKLDTPGFRKNQGIEPIQTRKNLGSYQNRSSKGNCLKEEVCLSSLHVSARKNLSIKIKKRCLKILKDLISDNKMIDFRQELLPFAIIALVREEFGFKNQDSD